MNDLKRAFLRFQALSAATHALCQQMIAHHVGDEQRAAEQARYEASFRGLVTELDASGTQRQFGRGQLIELRAPSGTTGTVAGWASTSDRDHHGHEVQNGAFTQSIRTRGLTGPKAIKLLLDHDWTKPAGVITLLEYRTKGLYIEAELDLSVSYVRDRWSVMQKIGGFNFSVGFLLEDREVKTDKNGDEYLFVRRGDLFEVSLVSFPSNESATLDVMASLPSAGGTTTSMLQRALDQVRAANLAINNL